MNRLHPLRLWASLSLPQRWAEHDTRTHEFYIQFALYEMGCIFSSRMKIETIKAIRKLTSYLPNLFHHKSSIKTVTCLFFIFEIQYYGNNINKSLQCTFYNFPKRWENRWKLTCTTLGFCAHTESLPSPVLRFWNCLLLPLARNSNRDWAELTESGFGMISHRWVTFMAGVGFYTRIED